MCLCVLSHSSQSLCVCKLAGCLIEYLKPDSSNYSWCALLADSIPLWFFLLARRWKSVVKYQCYHLSYLPYILAWHFRQKDGIAKCVSLLPRPLSAGRAAGGDVQRADSQGWGRVWGWNGSHGMFLSTSSLSLSICESYWVNIIWEKQNLGSTKGVCKSWSHGAQRITVGEWSQWELVVSHERRRWFAR